MNPVNERLGRKRGPTEKAIRKAVLDKCNQLKKEMSELHDTTMNTLNEWVKS